MANSTTIDVLKELEEAGAKDVTYREYPGVEHMVIVREALPDVFDFFDAVAQRK